MEITSAMVRELREKSGAAMMDCKRALSEAKGDMEQAFDYLRKQGLKSAEKKASREMGEGRVHAETSGTSGAMVAVTCETDFAGRAADFEAFLGDLINHVRAQPATGVDELLGQPWGKGGTVSDQVKALVGKLGENISIARVASYANPKGRVAAYIHHNNKVGVLVSVTTDKGADADPLIKDLCFHIAAYKPEYSNREEVPAAAVEREKEIHRGEVEKKPENIREKILAGKLDKFYAASVLLEQPWVRDDELTVGKVLEKELGKSARVEAFSRFEIG